MNRIIGIVMTCVLVISGVICAGYAALGDTAERGALDDIAFLAGTWRGEKDGGLVEEIWSEPHGNAMMGMFRWLNAEGQSRMYELLTISREDDQTLLRLRHFTPTMVAWEEKDAPVVLILAESSKGRTVFVNQSEHDRMDRIEFFRDGEDGLGIDVVFREESGRAPLNFRMHRAARGNLAPAWNAIMHGVNSIKEQHTMNPAYSAATTAAMTSTHVATMEAKRAVGPIVHLEPEEFRHLLERIEIPLLVYHHRKRGFLVAEAHRYMTGYCGLVFYCTSPAAIKLPEDAEVIRAKTISMVDG